MNDGHRPRTLSESRKNGTYGLHHRLWRDCRDTYFHNNEPNEPKMIPVAVPMEKTKISRTVVVIDKIIIRFGSSSFTRPMYVNSPE
jgi:hypothetical protein